MVAVWPVSPSPLIASVAAIDKVGISSFAIRPDAVDFTSAVPVEGADNLTVKLSLSSLAESPATCTVTILLVSSGAKLTVPEGRIPPRKSAASAPGKAPPATFQCALDAMSRLPERVTLKVKAVAAPLPSALTAFRAVMDNPASPSPSVGRPSIRFAACPGTSVPVSDPASRGRETAVRLSSPAGPASAMSTAGTSWAGMSCIASKAASASMAKRSWFSVFRMAILLSITVRFHAVKPEMGDRAVRDRRSLFRPPPAARSVTSVWRGFVTCLSRDGISNVASVSRWPERAGERERRPSRPVYGGRTSAA